MTAPHPGTIGPYRLLTELGRGDTGTVHLAMAPDDHLVAVKQIHHKMLASAGFRERFRADVAACRAVSSPHILPVIDAAPNASIPWLASDFAYGPSLAHVLATAGRLPADSVRFLALSLAAALNDIHAANLLHRHLKPSNVILTGTGPKLVDVNIADAKLTPGYTSPEQVDGNTATAASEIFALGTLLVTASTGNHPFDAATTLQTCYKIAHAAPELSQVPEGIRPFVRHCLHKDPTQRPSPADLLEKFGPLPETAAPAPAAVRGLIGWQRSEVDRRVRSLQPPRRFPNGATVRFGPSTVSRGEHDRPKLAGMITAGLPR